MNFTPDYSLSESISVESKEREGALSRAHFVGGRSLCKGYAILGAMARVVQQQKRQLQRCREEEVHGALSLLLPNVMVGKDVSQAAVGYLAAAVLLQLQLLRSPVKEEVRCKIQYHQRSSR